MSSKPKIVEDADEFIRLMKEKKRGKENGTYHDNTVDSSVHSGVRSGKGDLNLTSYIDSSEISPVYKERQPVGEQLELLPVDSEGNPKLEWGFDVVPNPFRVYLITKLDSFYWEHERYPTRTELVKWAEGYPTLKDRPVNQREWKEMLESIALPLINRGLPVYKTFNTGVDPEIVLVTNLFCDISDKRSKSAKLQAVDLTTAQFSALMRKKANAEYLISRFDRVFDEDLAVAAKMSIARMVEKDDLSAIKYYHEFSGKYRPQTASYLLQNQTALFTEYLSAIMQCLTKHVARDIITLVTSEIRNTPAIINILNSVEAQEKEVNLNGSDRKELDALSPGE